MKTKTLKEITEQAGNLIYKAIQKEGIAAGELTEIIQKACIAYARSIVPSEDRYTFDEENEESQEYEDYLQNSGATETLGEATAEGFNTCRSIILSHLSKEEELLN